jgi:hypothetical protein
MFPIRLSHTEPNLQNIPVPLTPEQKSEVDQVHKALYEEWIACEPPSEAYNLWPISVNTIAEAVGLTADELGLEGENEG